MRISNRAIISLCLFTIFVGCASTIPRKVPAATKFPTVQGETLTGKSVTLPDAFAGTPAIFLVGYTQRSQFDIDRWILGLKQLNVSTKIVEVPTIPGLMPGLAAGFITGGMKKGIPEEDWASVITVFKDGSKIVEITGNENPNNARVFLLGKQGEILWYFDRGYSAGRVLELAQAINEIKPD